MKRVAICVLLALGAIGGCKTLDAWMGTFSLDKDGNASASLEGAGEGGTFNKNQGLNLSLGDNGVPALLIAGLAGLVVAGAYPLQRWLRLRGESKARNQFKRFHNERLDDEVRARVAGTGDTLAGRVPAVKPGVRKPGQGDSADS